MEHFLSIEKSENRAEFLIDMSLFSKNIIFKTAFLLLDKVYVFFKQKDKNILLVQLKLKEGIEDSLEKIIGNFSDELLNNELRQKVFEENKEVRTGIITSALGNSLREAELPNSWKGYEDFSNTNTGSQIDFDKDIDDILKEIENDPDLKIDEEEIERVLREIEEETKLEKEEISINLQGIEAAKNQFKK